MLVLGSIIYLAAQVARAWDKMTPGEQLATKITAVAGAIALVVAVIAAQLKDVATLAVAAGVAAAAGIMIYGMSSNALSRGTSRSGYSNPGRYPMPAYAAVPYKMPMLATGTVVPPRAGMFAAILGDNNRETEVVSPLSTMKQALKEALAESNISSGNQIAKAELILDGTRFGQLVVKFGNNEKNRVGVRMVTEGSV